MKDTPLTKNQRKEHEALVEIINNEKEKAKQMANGIPHKYVKKANQVLINLYKTPRFHDNEKFLLARYTKLERKEVTWTGFFVPILFIILPICYKRLFCLFISFARSLSDLSFVLSLKNTLLCILYLVCILIFVGTVIWTSILLVKTVYAIFMSFSRTPASTIRDNELHIIEAILIEKGILFKLP